MGLHLGLSPGTLDNIQVNNQHHPRFQQRCKVEMFVEWLNGDATVNSYDEGVRRVSVAQKAVDSQEYGRLTVANSQPSRCLHD